MRFCLWEGKDSANACAMVWPVKEQSKSGMSVRMNGQTRKRRGWNAHDALSRRLDAGNLNLHRAPQELK